MGTLDHDGETSGDHDGETSGESRALVGGPKHNRSTTHDAKEPKPTHDNAAANHGNGVDGRGRKEPEKTPTTENYTQEKDKP
jgi:hypothetical protein